MARKALDPSRHPGEWFTIYDRIDKYATQVYAQNRDMCDLSRGRYIMINEESTAESFDIWPRHIVELFQTYYHDDPEPAIIKVEYWDRKLIAYSEKEVFARVGKETLIIHSGERKRNFRISLVGRLACVQNGNIYQILHNNRVLLEYNDPNILDVWIVKTIGSKATKKNLICKKYFQNGNIHISTVDYNRNTNTVISENMLSIEIMNNIRIIRGSELTYITDNDTGITITSEFSIVGYPEIVYLPGQYSYIKEVGKFYNNERKIWPEEIGYMSISMYRSICPRMLAYLRAMFLRFAFYMNNRLMCCTTSQSANKDPGDYAITVCHDLGLSDTPEVFAVCGNNLYYKDKDRVIMYDFVLNISDITSIPGNGLNMIRFVHTDDALFLYENNEIIIARHGDQLMKSTLKIGPNISSIYRDGHITVIANRRIYQVVGDVFLKKKIIKYSGGKKKPRAIPMWVAPEGIAVITNCHTPMESIGYNYNITKRKGPLYYTNGGFVYSRDYETSFKFGIPVAVEYFGNYLIEIHPDGTRYLNYNGVTIAPFDGLDFRIDTKSSKNTQ